ncbi:hypothetical protein LOK49_LG05G02442 [Camellia lanceoleosa]|uniref:Uncharacterized protein n=1 Tax=Camellia lanceoleosa TaxID=1840588 RepID=A0ACC0HWI9_9ERIC|nr:hypothetical protein LOK49_LG05G02442 [Camellia lanceoleosa]
MMNPSQMSPVSLVENYPLCQKREDGQVVLSSEECWRPRLLLLCYSMKILSEANSMRKLKIFLIIESSLASRLVLCPYTIYCLLCCSPMLIQNFHLSKAVTILTRKVGAGADDALDGGEGGVIQRRPETGIEEQ